MKLISLIAIILILLTQFACEKRPHHGDDISEGIANGSETPEAQAILDKLKKPNSSLPLVVVIDAMRDGESKEKLLTAFAELPASETFVVNIPVPAHKDELGQGKSPIFTFVRDDVDDDKLTGIKAFDANGVIIFLDMKKIPDRPVIAISRDEAIDENLSKTVSTATPPATAATATPAPAASPTPAASTPMERPSNASFAEQIETIEFSDVKEPWIKGAAEIYAIVSYTDRTGAGAAKLVDLSGVTEANVLYSPKKFLHFWQDNSYQVVDIAFYEHDSKHDFKDISKLLASAAVTATVVAQPELASGAPLANDLTSKTLDAIPKGILTDDDDFIDIFNGISKYNDISKTDLSGMMGKTRMTLKTVDVKKTDETAR